MSSITSLLSERGMIRTFRRGAPILFQGEIPRNVYIVANGLVRAYNITSGGDERTIALYGKGDAFPLSFAIGQANSALFYYEALSDSRILVVSKADFDETLDRNPDAARSMVDLLGREYTSLMLRVTAMSQSRTIEKLAYTFYYLSTRYGLARGDWHLIDIKLNQLMLGDLIGQTREGTARNLKTLVERGLIKYKGSSYSIQREKLIAFLGEDAFRDISAS